VCLPQEGVRRKDLLQFVVDDPGLQHDVEGPVRVLRTGGHVLEDRTGTAGILPPHERLKDHAVGIQLVLCHELLVEFPAMIPQPYPHPCAEFGIVLAVLAAKLAEFAFGVYNKTHDDSLSDDNKVFC
jgi:hypothetical protein